MKFESFDGCFSNIFTTGLSAQDIKKIQNLTVPVSKQEGDRISTLRASQLLDTPSEATFDRYTNLCSRLFKTPIALVSLVDVERQWFKSRVGLAATETHRNDAFCSYTVLEETNDVFIVRDAAQDNRFQDNPLVTGFPHIRFYAGAAIVISGQKIGSLCIIDDKPRPEFSQKDAGILREIAMMVEDAIEQRRRAFIDPENDIARMTISILHTLRFPLMTLTKQREVLAESIASSRLQTQAEKGGESDQQHLKAFQKQLFMFQRYVYQLQGILESSLSLALTSSGAACSLNCSFLRTANYVREQNNMTNKQNYVNSNLYMTALRNSCQMKTMRLNEVADNLRRSLKEFYSLDNKVVWKYGSTIFKSAYIDRTIDMNDGSSKLASVADRTSVVTNVQLLRLVLNTVMIHTMCTYTDFSAMISFQKVLSEFQSSKVGRNSLKEDEDLFDVGQVQLGIVINVHSVMKGNRDKAISKESVHCA